MLPAQARHRACSREKRMRTRPGRVRFFKVLSCGTRPGRVRSRFSQQQQRMHRGSRVPRGRGDDCCLCGWLVHTPRKWTLYIWMRQPNRATSHRGAGASTRTQRGKRRCPPSGPRTISVNAIMRLGSGPRPLPCPPTGPTHAAVGALVAPQLPVRRATGGVHFTRPGIARHRQGILWTWTVLFACLTTLLCSRTSKLCPETRNRSGSAVLPGEFIDSAYRGVAAAACAAAAACEPLAPGACI
eukprot:gene23709-biopygen4355